MGAITKIILLPVSLVLGLTGCANKTYILTSTSFGYDPNYGSWDVTVNNELVGGGFGAGTKRSAFILGPQVVRWKEGKRKVHHKNTNTLNLTKADLKNKKYLAVHLYPDDTVEITTSNDLPDPTPKGLEWRAKLMDERDTKKDNKNVN